MQCAAADELSRDPRFAKVTLIHRTTAKASAVYTYGSPPHDWATVWAERTDCWRLTVDKPCDARVELLPIACDTHYGLHILDKAV